MPQIFISYSRKDIEFVDRLANDLKASGFEVWYDLSGLKAGTQWGTEIQNAINSSQYFLVVLSPNSVKSSWVEREFLHASDQNIKIVPLLYQQCALPMWSLNLHFIDMQGKNYSRKYHDLLKIMGVQPESVEENPITIHYIKIGDEYRKMGQPDQAIESYLQALNVEPNNLKAQSTIGAIHLEQQAYAEAAAAFDLALEISGEDLVAKSGWGDANLSLGNQARADGKIEEATRFYLEVIRISPDDANALKSLANIYITQAEDLLAFGKEDEAISAFSEALTFTPHDKTLSAHLKKLKSEKKARVLKEFVARSEEELDAGKWEKAIETLNEALESAPQEKSILKKIDDIRDQQRDEQLKVILLKVEQAEESERWDVAIAGLNEYLKMKHDDKVIQKRRADLMASKRETWLNSIHLRVNQAVENHKWDEALIILNESLELEPENKELKARATQVKKDQIIAKLNAIILRAEQAASVGRWNDSIEILNKGLMDDPNEKVLKTKLAEIMQFKREEKHKSALNLADMAARSEKWETAVSSLNEILASEPDNPVFLKKFDEVLKLERASKLKLLQMQAKNLVKAEKFVEALAAWNEQLALEPENRQAVLDEIEAVNKAQKLADLYSKGTDALADKNHLKAVEFFKRVEMEDVNYKSAAKLRAKAEKRLGIADKAPLSGKRRILIAVAAFLVVALAISTVVFWPEQTVNNTDPGANTFDINGQESDIVDNTGQESDILDNTDQESDPSDSEVYTPPVGETITVTSTEDDGEGTFRQALLDAQAGDTITFDTSVFQPDNPATIVLTSDGLPRVKYGNITIDGSNAGVILDGKNIHPENSGLVVNSDRNTIMGLQIFNFGTAIYLEGGSFNTIGGDRSIGVGPTGQGNLLGGVGHVGIGILPGSGGNQITGNLIGTNLDGTESFGFMGAGIIFEGDAGENGRFFNPNNNIIGPDNVIANNGVEEGDQNGGVVIFSVQVSVTITGNTFHNNANGGIVYPDHPGAEWDLIPEPPTIIYFDLETGIVRGQTCDSCLVEIFSTESDEGELYEGSTTANQYGNFFFSKGEALTGPFLVATAHHEGDNTSVFSSPTSIRSDIQTALDEILETEPFYQTGFDTSYQGPVGPGADLENGKLTVTSDIGHVGSGLPSIVSGSFAVEFELRFLESSIEKTSICLFFVESADDESNRSLFTIFYGPYLNKVIQYNNSPEYQDILAETKNEFDFSTINKITIIILGDQIAAFVNGQIIYTALDPNGNVDYSYQSFAAEDSVTCEFDNYKIWDLDVIDEMQIAD